MPENPTPSKKVRSRSRIAAGLAVTALLAAALFGLFKWAHVGVGGVIPYTEAANYVGQEKTVEGTVEWVLKGNLTVLNFNVAEKPNLQVAIPPGARGAFPAGFALFYLDKTVRVTGTIESYKGTPKIVVNLPSKIRIVGEAKRDFTPNQNNLISYKDVGNFIDQIKTVEGTVEAITIPDEYVTWLKFETDNLQGFQVAIFSSVYDRFSKTPEELYKDKKVWVAGKIAAYKEGFEMVVNSPSQIRIVQDGKKG